MQRWARRNGIPSRNARVRAFPPTAVRGHPLRLYVVVAPDAPAEPSRVLSEHGTLLLLSSALAHEDRLAAIERFMKEVETDDA